jgi:hypothetical protein
VLDACRGDLRDDATVLILDWHGNRRPSPESRTPSRDKRERFTP